MSKLSHHVTDLISKRVASLPSGKHDLEEMKKLTEMISAHSPFHYVMDAANVGHAGGTSISFNKVLLAEVCYSCKLWLKRSCNQIPYAYFNM